jgi:hypothetical protein
LLNSTLAPGVVANVAVTGDHQRRYNLNIPADIQQRNWQPYYAVQRGESRQHDSYRVCSTWIQHTVQWFKYPDRYRHRRWPRASQRDSGEQYGDNC